jgi:NADH-quinone oxidoreductase subunit M
MRSETLTEHLLSLLLFSPLVGVILVLALPARQRKLLGWVAFAASLLPLVLAIVAWLRYDSANPAFQLMEQATWFGTVNASYHIGIDGISLPMVLLTTLLVPLCILASLKVERIKGFMALFLLLEIGALGVFMALDLLLFFLFYEIGLVPMYFLINQWGSPTSVREGVAGKSMPGRQYASFKFMIYTMFASLGLLLAIQVIGITTGTFDLTTLYSIWPTFDKPIMAGIPVELVKNVAFWAFFVAFALKIPLWPLHTWLPDAHTEAPTAGSMILAGVLLKLGAFGFFRLVIPLFPEQAHAAAPLIAILAMLSIVLGAYAAYGQTDFKRLVAYSSVNHMGFVVLGIAAFAWAYNGQDTAQSLSATIAGSGAILQMFNHGLSAAAMFFMVGVVYERTHTRDLNKIGGGIWQYAPVYGALLIFNSMASLGLPGLNGFVGEFSIIRGSWPIFTTVTALSMLGLLMTGAYVLKGIGKVLHGPRNPEWEHEHTADSSHVHVAAAHTDAHGHAEHAPFELKGRHFMEITPLEIAVVAPLMVLMLVIGLWPTWIMEIINATVSRLVG